MAKEFAEFARMQQEEGDGETVLLSAKHFMKTFKLTSRTYLLFAWYDLWVGIFINQPKRHLYVFPIPCVGILHCY